MQCRLLADEDQYIDKKEVVITWVEEHVADGRRLFVNLDRVAGQDDALRDDSCGVRMQEASHRDQLRCFTNSQCLRLDADRACKYSPWGSSVSRRSEHGCMP